MTGAGVTVGTRLGDLTALTTDDLAGTSLVTGEGAGRDVPVTPVARDPAVAARVDAWGWTEGLEPEPGAPVLPVDAFRDRFPGAFG